MSVFACMHFCFLENWSLSLSLIRLHLVCVPFLLYGYYPLDKVVAVVGFIFVLNCQFLECVHITMNASDNSNALFLIFYLSSYLCAQNSLYEKCTMLWRKKSTGNTIRSHSVTATWHILMEFFFWHARQRFQPFSPNLHEKKKNTLIKITDKITHFFICWFSLTSGA